jgi:hypothetical protein
VNNNSNYTFKRISLEEFANMKYECSFPSCDREWLIEWYNLFLEKNNNVVGFAKQLYLITSYKDGEIVSLLPLISVQRKYLGFISIRFLEYLGQQWSSFGNDLIQMEDLGADFLLDLRRWLKANIPYHFLFFKYMPKDSIFRKKFRFYTHGGIPIIDISKYEDYISYRKNQYSRNLRDNIRKAINRAKRDGIQFEESIEEINEFNFQEIKRISATKLIDGKGFVYEDKEKEKFYRFVYRNFESNVVFIKFNGTAVSYRTNIFINGNKYGVDAAYNREYRKYNLGIWTVDASIKDSFSRGIKLQSMGPGFDSYKFKFANSVDNYFMCVDWKFRIKSILIMPYFSFLLRKKNNSVIRELQSFGF